MNLRFTDPWWLLLFLVVVPWTLVCHLRSDVSMSASRKWISLGLRLLVIALILLSIAGLQHLRPIEGMNVFFVMDRSDSVPGSQQEAARQFVNRTATMKKKTDRGGVVVFGSSASIESSANAVVDLQKIHSIISSERTDIAGAVRLSAAAFPETGQKRIVLMSDGQSNMGPDPLAMANIAAEHGVRIFTVGVGTPEGATLSSNGWSMRVRLDEDTLKKIATTTRADYYRAGDAAALKKIYSKLSSKLVLEKRQTMEVSALFAALGAALALCAALLSLSWFNRII